MSVPPRPVAPSPTASGPRTTPPAPQPPRGQGSAARRGESRIPSPNHNRPTPAGASAFDRPQPGPPQGLSPPEADAMSRARPGKHRPARNAMDTPPPLPNSFRQGPDAA